MTAYECLQELLTSLGFRINRKKSVPPTRELIFLGININTLHQTMSLPQGKLESLQLELLNWQKKRRVTKLLAMVDDKIPSMLCEPQFPHRKLIITVQRAKIHGSFLASDFWYRLNLTSSQKVPKIFSFKSCKSSVKVLYPIPLVSELVLLAGHCTMWMSLCLSGREHTLPSPWCMPNVLCYIRLH